MKVSCPDLVYENGLIKEEYTGDGADVSPEIVWSDFPEKTKSFAVYCHDPDAPVGDWVHWIVINVPAHVTSIPKGGPVPGKQIANDFGKEEYGGPAPPSGVHRYYYIVYALSVPRLEGINKDNFLEKIKPVTLAKEEVMGKYTR